MTVESLRPTQPLHWRTRRVSFDSRLSPSKEERRLIRMGRPSLLLISIALLKIAATDCMSLEMFVGCLGCNCVGVLVGTV